MNIKSISSIVLISMLILAGIVSPFPGVNKAEATTATFTTPVTTTWTAPADVASVVVECWGGGGGGGGGFTSGGGGGYGGGGGAYAKKTIGVTPGNSYTYTVGVGGAGGGAQGSNGGVSTFTGDGGVQCVADSGKGGSEGFGGTIGVGGTTANSDGTVEFAGGNGANPPGGNAGGGGGGSGGSASTGNVGSGATGATAVTDGGPGGNGGAVFGASGSAPASGPGGGGGAGGGRSGGAEAGGDGFAGKIKLTYTAVQSTNIGNGTDGSNSTIAPGASATEIDRFSLKTSSGSDTVTGLSVTILPVNAYTNIGTVAVQTTGGVTKCSATATTSVVTLTSCGISVTTSLTEYKIMVTPKTHAAMDGVSTGESYPTTATITGVTSTLPVLGGDDTSATITIDNRSPREAGSAGYYWTMRNSASTAWWQGVAYGNGKYVAVANSNTTGGRVMTSTDGITWATTTTPVDNQWMDVTYGNGLFVAVAITGSGNRVMTSSDGLSWSTQNTTGKDFSWNSVTYGNGLYVAVGSTAGTGNQIMISSDGISWTLYTSGADRAWQDVVYGNGTFVAVASSGTGNRIMTSTNGTIWTAQTSPADYQWMSIDYGEGLFVAVTQTTGTNNQIMTSPDGITWTLRTSPQSNSWNNIAYGNGVFVALSGGCTGCKPMISDDGMIWESTNALSYEFNSWTGIVYGSSGGFVVVGYSGTNQVMTSGTSTPLVSEGDTQNYLSWVNPGGSDYSKTIVLRRSGSAVTDTPVEGTSYATSTAVGSSVVACVGNQTSCADTGLTNGTAYYYKIFIQDPRGNFSAAGIVPSGSPMTPAAPSLNLAAYRFFANSSSTEFGTVGATDSDADSVTPYDIAIDQNYIYTVGTQSTTETDYRIEKKSIITGELDNNFGVNGVIQGSSVSTYLYGIAIDSTYMYVVGEDSNAGVPQLRIEKRLLSTGALCTAANCGTAFDTDGMIVPGADGEWANDIAIDSTYMYVTGSYWDNSTYTMRVQKRLLSTGALCTAANCGTAFGSSGIANSVATTYAGQDIAIDGTYLYVVGTTDSNGSGPPTMEKRLLSTGALCTAANCGTAFDTDGIVDGSANNFWNHIYVDGTYLYIGAQASSLGKVEKRLATTGQLCDGTGGICGGTTFGVAGGLTISTNIAIYSIFASSTDLYAFGQKNITGDWTINKFNSSDGSANNSFGVSGQIVSDAITSGLKAQAINAEHMFITGGDNDGWRIEKRLLSDGSLALLMPGSPLALENSSTSIATSSSQFRLRMRIAVSSAQLGASNKNFKLQYAEKSGTCDTAFTGETYADITTITPISFYDNTYPLDGNLIYSNSNDPTYSGRTAVYQTYEEANNFTNPTSVPSGSDGLWDFSLYENGANGGTSYCIRVVKSDGGVLNTYTVIPEIITAAQATAVSQLHYRWRNDFGTESGASYAAAEDATITSGVEVGDRIRLRFLLRNTSGSAANYNYRLETASSSCSTWMQVATSPTGNPHWIMDTSSRVANGESTTNSSGLTDPAGNFVPGYVMTQDSQTPALSLTSGQFTELEYSIRSTSNISTNTVYCFRLTNAGDTSIFTFAQQPQITIPPIGTVRPRGGGGGNAGGEANGVGPIVPGGGTGGGGGSTGGSGSGGSTGGGGSGGGGGDTGFIWFPRFLAIASNLFILTNEEFSFGYIIKIK